MDRLTADLSVVDRAAAQDRVVVRSDATNGIVPLAPRDIMTLAAHWVMSLADRRFVSFAPLDVVALADDRVMPLAALCRVPADAPVMPRTHIARMALADARIVALARRM